MTRRQSIHLSTLGCRLNEAELMQWSRQFHLAGLEVRQAAAGADVIVLNSCAVTGEAVKKSRRLLRRLRRESPDARVILTGCYASLAPEEAAGLLGVDLVIGNADKDTLVPEVLEHLGADTAPIARAAPDASPLLAGSRTRAFVKVQDGCRNRCTFCIVTIARGPERSRPVDDIVAEVRRHREAGYQEVVLTGVHLGGYGSDLGVGLSELVAGVLERTDIPRVRLGSLEPWDLPADFFSLWEAPRLCPHLHLPLQSGCDDTLRRMARRCPTGSYRALVAAARAAIPDLHLTTDLIVGFPGEDEREFTEGLAFIGEIGFGHMHVFAWSPREGTAAARMPDRVSEAVKRHRSRAVKALAAEQKAARLARAVGTVRPVLWEQPVAARDGLLRWRGYTDSYLPVQKHAPAHLRLENRITDTQLLGVLDGERLLGGTA